MAELVQGNKIAEGIFRDLRLKMKDLRIKPRLVVFLVGQNLSSISYIKMKQRRGEEIGLDVDIQEFPETISEGELQGAIKKASKETDVCGILVQLPLPGHLPKQIILDTVPADLDVDCLTTANKQKLISGNKIIFTPPAAVAVMKIFEYYQIDLTAVNVLLIGSGDLIGRPLATIFLKNKIDFNQANKHTENLPELAKRADVIISGVGKPGLLTADMIKAGAVVIDAGTTGAETGEMVGDVDFARVEKKAKLIAPVPGGVGPVTIAMLFANVVTAAFLKQQI